MSSSPLTPRAQRILEAVVETFVTTGEPVGSRTVACRYELDVSPATVRNDMTELEERGFVTQPYTSAGRVPTEQGFRWYVDRMGARPARRGDRERLNRVFLGDGLDLSDALRQASRALSAAVRCTGMAVSPSFEDTVFHHIEFVRLADHQVLVILVSAEGSVMNRHVRIDDDATQRDLERISVRLNERLTGAPLAQVRDRLSAEVERDRVRYAGLWREVAALSDRMASGGGHAEVFVEGTCNLLGHREFADLGRVQTLLSALEDQELIIEILDRARSAGGVSVAIGSEAGIRGIEEAALVAAPYGPDGAPVGTIAVIGPRRLDYSRVIPMVEYAGRLVSRFLTTH